MASKPVLSQYIYLLINKVSHGYNWEQNFGNPFNQSVSLPTPKFCFTTCVKDWQTFFYKEPNNVGFAGHALSLITTQLSAIVPQKQPQKLYQIEPKRRITSCNSGGREKDIHTHIHIHTEKERERNKLPLVYTLNTQTYLLQGYYNSRHVYGMNKEYAIRIHNYQ